MKSRLATFLNVFFFVFASTLYVYAQPIEDAKRNIEYEKYTTAQQILKAFLQNSKLKETDIEQATFYLGRAYLLNAQTQEARLVYQNAIKVIPASPLCMVGLGSVLLLEGSINEAQTLFDNALLQTKSKDIQVYTALAYAYTKAKAVDAKYALNKFSTIPEKTKKDAPFYIALGDFYKRLKYGNDVYASYQKALVLESDNIAAKFRLGKLFKNQHNDNQYIQYMMDVIQLDKNFAPAYKELYLYYYNIDIEKSKAYFLTYKSLVETSPSLEYEEASIMYASKDFQKSLQNTLALISKYQNQTDPRCYRLAGYTYNQLNDSVKALEYLTLYFNKADPEDVDVDNYRFMGSLLNRFTDKEKDAIQYYEKAYLADSTPLEKVKDIRDIVSIYKKTKNYKMQAYWDGVLYTMNPKQSSADLFNWGFASYLAEDFVTADTVFSTYIQKYPNEYFGYLWKARTRYASDTTKVSSLPYFQKTIEFAQQDTVKYKKILSDCYAVLYEYNRNVIKNYQEALQYLDKLIVYTSADPSELMKERDAIVKYIESTSKKKAPHTTK